MGVVSRRQSRREAARQVILEPEDVREAIDHALLRADRGGVDVRQPRDNLDVVADSLIAPVNVVPHPQQLDESPNDVRVQRAGLPDRLLLVQLRDPIGIDHNQVIERLKSERQRDRQSGGEPVVAGFARQVFEGEHNHTNPAGRGRRIGDRSERCKTQCAARVAEPFVADETCKQWVPRDVEIDPRVVFIRFHILIHPSHRVIEIADRGIRAHHAHRIRLSLLALDSSQRLPRLGLAPSRGDDHRRFLFHERRRLPGACGAPG